MSDALTEHVLFQCGSDNERLSRVTQELAAHVGQQKAQKFLGVLTEVLGEVNLRLQADAGADPRALIMGAVASFHSKMSEKG